jgi:hypothetical protein
MIASWFDFDLKLKPACIHAQILDVRSTGIGIEFNSLPVTCKPQRIERVQITTTSSIVCIAKTPILGWQRFTLWIQSSRTYYQLKGVLLINDVAEAAESVIFVAGVTTYRERF